MIRDTGAGGRHGKPLLRLRWQPDWTAFDAGADSIDLICGGAAYFDQLIADIGQARSEVLLESYIFADDAAGHAVAQALCGAARRGVMVRLVTDWVGTPVQPYRSELEAAGVRCRVFNPRWFGRQGFSRTHRKIAVIDGRSAFVGGINIIDDLNDGHGRVLGAPRWDFAVRLCGQLAVDVRRAFMQQWEAMEAGYRSPMALVRDLTLERRRFGAAGTQAALAFVARDNLRQRRTIENAYLHAIFSAKREIWLANPYFAPGWRLRRALVLAARRGVRVHLLLGRKEFQLLDWAVPALYGKFLESGVRIAEYDRTLLHAKVAVVDDDWATVGSSNCDALSFFLNHEANVLIRGHPLISELKRRIASAFEVEARQVDPCQYGGRPLLTRFGNWCAYVAYRLVMKALTVGRFR